MGEKENCKGHKLLPNPHNSNLHLEGAFLFSLSQPCSLYISLEIHVRREFFFPNKKKLSIFSIFK